jgi:hypothetical protein
MYNLQMLRRRSERRGCLFTFSFAQTHYGQKSKKWADSAIISEKIQVCPCFASLRKKDEDNSQKIDY